MKDLKRGEGKSKNRRTESDVFIEEEGRTQRTRTTERNTTRDMSFIKKFSPLSRSIIGYEAEGQLSD